MSIHHVCLHVTDLDRSASFYDATLRPLGWRRVVDGPQTCGWGLTEAVLLIAHSAEAAPGFGHVVVPARGSPAVRAAFDAGLAAGGGSLHEPGQRPDIGPAAYGADLLDPDGYHVRVVSA